jgi:hypothetical protein
LYFDIFSKNKKIKIKMQWIAGEYIQGRKYKLLIDPEKYKCLIHISNLKADASFGKKPEALKVPLHQVKQGILCPR